MFAPDSSNGEADHGFQIAPMVDVVFVLLLFFMALAGAQSLERHLTAQLPGPGSVADDLPIVVDISDQGVVICNGLTLAEGGDTALDRFRTWLGGVTQAGAKTPVIIRPHPHTQHERFLQVLATLQRAGLRNVSFS